MGKLLTVTLFIFILSFSSLSSAETAPDFTLQDKEGYEHTLSDYSGKPIFLLFISQTDFDVDILKDIVKDYSDYDIVFLAIHSEEDELDWNFSDFPLLYDEYEEIFSDYDIDGKINIVLIDERQSITAQFDSNFDTYELKSELNKILGVTGVEGVTWGKIKSLYMH
jgi:peroxiredoxin